MKVIATKQGTYPSDTRRRVGDVFELETSIHFNEKWMESVEKKAAPKPKAKPKAATSSNPEKSEAPLA